MRPSKTALSWHQRSPLHSLSRNGLVCPGHHGDIAYGARGPPAMQCAAKSGGAGGHSGGRAACCGVVLAQVEIRDAARQLRREAAKTRGDTHLSKHGPTSHRRHRAQQRPPSSNRPCNVVVSPLCEALAPQSGVLIIDGKAHQQRMIAALCSAAWAPQDALATSTTRC